MTLLKEMFDARVPDPAVAVDSCRMAVHISNVSDDSLRCAYALLDTRCRRRTGTQEASSHLA